MTLKGLIDKTKLVYDIKRLKMNKMNYYTKLQF